MKDILYRLFEHQYLGRDEAHRILHNIATGCYDDAQIASLITVFLMRNISVDELMGFREALLDMRVPVDLAEYKPIDIVGTGGDGKNTFNISTAACFVVAGAGYKVVKHGNYGATSVSGASNVMQQHGVKFTTDVGQLRRSIEDCNLAYLHAPLFNPALKAVANVRKHLGVRSFFNMLGPLVNPVMPTYQLLGVYNLPLLRLYNYTYQESRTRFAVVHSLNGYDEISLTGDSKLRPPIKKNSIPPRCWASSASPKPTSTEAKLPKRRPVSSTPCSMGLQPVPNAIASLRMPASLSTSSVRSCRWPIA